MLEDLSEAHEDGRSDAAQHQRIEQFLQVDAPVWLFGRVNAQMSVIGDRKIPFPPTCHIIELSRVGGCPPLGWLQHLRTVNLQRCQLSEFLHQDYYHLNDRTHQV